MRWLMATQWNAYSPKCPPKHAVQDGKSLCGIEQSQWGIELRNIRKCKKCLAILTRMEKENTKA